MTATPRVVPRLHLITNRHLCRERAQLAIIAEAAQAGVGAVQLREKDLASAALLDEAQALQTVLGATPLLINSDLLVAQTVGAAGVHLPEGIGTVQVARAQLGQDALIGRSVHSAAGAIAAAAEEVDYLILGTIFSTASKPGRAPAGLTLVRDVAAAVTVPTIAIGGIDQTNAAAVLAAGAWGFAVMSGILTAPQPAQAVAALQQVIEQEGR